MLVLHYTGMRTADEAVARLCDPEAQVSAHYVVDEDGAILRLVAEERRAWHAGKGAWQGETDCNAASIGIEIVNPGHEFGYRDFPEVQIDAVISLINDIRTRWTIPDARIIGHSDLAPERKQDPGERFPWKRLAAIGHGLWFEPAPERIAALGVPLGDAPGDKDALGEGERVGVMLAVIDPLSLPVGVPEGGALCGADAVAHASRLPTADHC
jgi:N-acetylmuramoyl-L-alanine amidase